MTPRFHPAVAFLWLWITVVTSSAQPVTTLIPLPAGGRLATEFMADFPREGLQLYVLETAPPAPPTKVFCLAWDPLAPTLPLFPGSADSALLVTLAPGAYTAVIESPTGAGGVALVEVYEVR